MIVPALNASEYNNLLYLIKEHRGKVTKYMCFTYFDVKFLQAKGNMRAGNVNGFHLELMK